MRNALILISTFSFPVFSAPIDVVYWDFDPAPFLYSGVTVEADHGGLIHAAGLQGMGNDGNVFNNRLMSSGNGLIEFDFHGLPVHDFINFGFLLAVIDSWDGVPPIGCCNPDYFSISIQNLDDPSQSTTLLSTSFNNVNGFLSVDPGPDNQLYPRNLGNQIIGPNQNLISIWQLPDAAYDMGLDPGLQNIGNSWQNVKIKLYAFGDGYQPWDESFAVDNFKVSVGVTESAAAIPEPSTLVLLCLGALPLIWIRRRVGSVRTGH